MLLTLAWNQYVLGLLMVLFLVICGLVILTILVQRPQGGGLAGAFGGGSGSGQTAFGTKTGDALTVLTISMFVVYLLAAIVLNYGIKATANPPAEPQIVDPGGPQPSPAPTSDSSAPATPADGAVPAGPPANVPPGTEGSATVPPATPPALPSTTPSTPPAEAPKTDAPTTPK
jgi:preprotein translocase subunit SecG